MQIAFVGFQPIQSSEHMGALGVFGLCQLIAFYNYAKSKLTTEQFDVLFRAAVMTFGGVGFVAGTILTLSGSELTY
jgi:dolichyl-diphosphooligosaccharide--protein glycosyltransferase